ncbi:MoeA N-terminal and linker domain-containing protein [Caenorhabditis elegans]|uniref:LIN-46 n=1 Tax=Caenorhabditis elegans TaxID=6239 RepID=G5EF06_CAEEL|nr:MoeA N-terminal and linker domain-containing protein [Caenorhabditis elegans]AAB97841.1 LIN-46 [Caenorhabditis elegans]AAB97842.1 LIN-46 [Caenorhabditis elegans]CAB01440.2 MoeA N-terminal and linker domain-containing protein [Caenorhabditis elegans]|eukprot:NP_506246.1 Uncharacterized protein CELE_R186.4 [Caenorhabditis elegans]
MSSSGLLKPATLDDVFQKLEDLCKLFPPQEKTVNVTSLKTGRILAEDIITEYDIPAQRTSIVDGFAIIVNQLGTKREIVGLSTAVTPYNAELISNECVRITIGGVVPDGADTVVPIENVALLKEEKCIEVLRKPKEGDNIREVGSEAKTGEILLKDGHHLDTMSITLLHALGISQVEIYKKPRVCVLSIGSDLNSNKMYGSFNRSQLLELFQSQGFTAIDAGSSTEHITEVEEKIRTAASFACVLVTVGGAQVIREVAKTLKFKFEIQDVDSTPGNFTVSTGKIDETPVVLSIFPEYHVSSWIGANLFVSPILRAMEGQNSETSHRFKAELTQPISKTSETRFLRARSEVSKGNLISTPLGCEDIFGANSILEVKSNTCFSAGDVVDLRFA